MSGVICGRRQGPHGRCGAVLGLSVLDGRLVERCPACERRERGICRDCPRPVYGTIGKALRCEDCTREARRAADRKHRSDPDYKRKAAKKWQRRSARMTPEEKARRVERLRQWVADHPEQVKKARRRAALNPTPRQRATERRWNSVPERIQAKREQARRRYYELHPERPAPVCAKCEKGIEWQPLPGGRSGRPPKYHMDCSPWKRQRKDYRQAVA